MPADVSLINSLIDGIDFAMLTSVHPNGRLHSRPMVAQPVTPDGVVWFFSPRHTLKVDEIRHSDEVNITYADPERQRYVSLSGRCETVSSTDLAQEMWSDAHEKWLPRKLGDSDLILLRITIHSGECWDAGAGNIFPLVSEEDPQQRDVA